MSFDCIIAGAGPAGLKAASLLDALGYEVYILEKEKIPGGKLNIWHELFPYNERASLIREQMLAGTSHRIRTSVTIKSISRTNGEFCLKDRNEDEYCAPALLIATGFRPFDACQKEEYGYGIYDNVITSVIYSIPVLFLLACKSTGMEYMTM